MKVDFFIGASNIYGYLDDWEDILRLLDEISVLFLFTDENVCNRYIFSLYVIILYIIEVVWMSSTIKVWKQYYNGQLTCLLSLPP